MKKLIFLLFLLFICSSARATQYGVEVWFETPYNASALNTWIVAHDTSTVWVNSYHYYMYTATSTTIYHFDGRICVQQENRCDQIINYLTGVWDAYVSQIGSGYIGKLILNVDTDTASYRKNVRLK